MAIAHIPVRTRVPGWAAVVVLALMLLFGKLPQLLGASLPSRSAIPITVTIDSDCTLTPAVQLACYRIAQESLNNAVKHAAATQVTVSVDCAPDEVLLRVSDDGRGFEDAGA
ncbi:MAG: hypothetical protein HGA45_31675 [Chloroflexales bacterium]|nr:hypothetical protein [Chloroflexales bacterium]